MNRQLSVQVALPSVPTVPDTLPMSAEFRRWLKSLTQYLLDANRQLSADLGNVHDQINSAVQGVGDDLASGPTLTPAPSSPIHVVTGTAAIATIPVPLGFSGPLWVIPAGTWTLVAQVTNPDGSKTGNIALAATAVVGRVMHVVYNPRTGLWYPSY